jgi:hypothetical protein
VLAGEVNPPLGGRQRVEESDLAWCVERERSAFPRIEPPAVREPAFVFLAQLRKDLRGLLACRGTRSSSLIVSSADV